MPLIYLIIFLGVLFLLSYTLKILDLLGSVFAFILGFSVTYFGSIYYLFLLIIFVAVSYASTKYKHSVKENISGFENTRSWRSVLSKGIIPLAVAVSPIDPYSKEILFSAAVAAATADTVSGELGVLSNNAFYITNLRKAKPGDNGAVSITGEIWALIGSLVIGFFSILFFGTGIYSFSIIVVSGFLGSQVDSILGSLLENRGKMKKFSVNIIAIGISIIFAYLLML